MNTNTQHTKGDWAVIGETEDGAFEINTVAEMFDPPIANVYDEADARLIAAAPDLLTALIRLDRIERGLDGWHEDAKPDAWLAARAAIAKAEGTPYRKPH